jgi:hypothetical protein
MEILQTVLMTMLAGVCTDLEAEGHNSNEVTNVVRSSGQDDLKGELILIFVI